MLIVVLFCFFSIEFEPLRSESIRSTTLVRVLHRFVLLPNRVSSKMLISLDTLTINAMIVVSLLSICLATYHLNVSLSTFP